MISKEEFNDTRYGILPSGYDVSRRINVFPYLMEDGTNLFEMTIRDSENYYTFYVSMESPELAVESDEDYNISSQDIDDLMSILIDDGQWESIIKAMKDYKEDFPDECVYKLDKIPPIPPDYSALVREV